MHTISNTTTQFQQNTFGPLQRSSILITFLSSSSGPAWKKTFQRKTTQSGGLTALRTAEKTLSLTGMTSVHCESHGDMGPKPGLDSIWSLSSTVKGPNLSLFKAVCKNDAKNQLIFKLVILKNSKFRKTQPQRWRSISAGKLIVIQLWTSVFFFN